MLDAREESAIKNAYQMLSLVLNSLMNDEIDAVDGDALIEILQELEAVFNDFIVIEKDEADPGDLDGDATSALASAGCGTDEDYGGANEQD